MSTNPATKTYQRRVARIGKRLRYARSGDDLRATMYGVDPGATDAIYEAAITYAIDDARSSAALHRKYADEAEVEVAFLERSLDRLKKPGWKLIGGEDEPDRPRIGGLKVYGGRNRKTRRP